jgi:hypothetical protein
MVKSVVFGPKSRDFDGKTLLRYKSRSYDFFTYKIRILPCVQLTTCKFITKNPEIKGNYDMTDELSIQLKQLKKAKVRAQGPSTGFYSPESKR